MYLSNSKSNNKSNKSFAHTCITKINDKTFEIDLFGYLRKTNFNAIVVSNESMMAKAFNGKLKWITEYDDVDDLLKKTDKFISRKNNLPYFIKNVIMVSLEYNIQTFSDIINSLKKDDQVTQTIAHRKYASEVPVRRSSDVLRNCNNLDISKEIEHTAAYCCDKCKRNLNDVVFS